MADAQAQLPGGADLGAEDESVAYKAAEERSAEVDRLLEEFPPVPDAEASVVLQPESAASSSSTSVPS